MAASSRIFSRIAGKPSGALRDDRRAPVVRVGFLISDRHIPAELLDSLRRRSLDARSECIRLFLNASDDGDQTILVEILK